MNRHGFEIRNNKLHPEESRGCSEVKTYFLSDEELEKYRKGDKERETMAESNYEQLKAKFPTLESLMTSLNGISIPQWAKFHGVKKSDFYKLKKEYEAQFRGEELDLISLGYTQDEAKKLIQDINEESNQELEYADQYIVRDIHDDTEDEFNSLDEAILHIKTQYTLATVGQVRLLKEIPFNMQVNVTIGKG